MLYVNFRRSESVIIEYDTGKTAADGGLLTASSGYITSNDANLDGEYDNNLDTLWQILIERNKVIAFEILEMDIYMLTGQCEEDFLEVCSLC